MASYSPDISPDLEFIPENDRFCFCFVNFGYEDFRLSCFRIPLPFLLPHGTNTLFDQMVACAGRDGSVRDGLEHRAFFGKFVGSFIARCANMGFCPDAETTEVTNSLT